MSAIAGIEAERVRQSGITHFADDATLARIAELERENKKLNRCVDLAIRIFRDNGNHGYVKAMEELAASAKENERG